MPKYPTLPTLAQQKGTIPLIGGLDSGSGSFSPSDIANLAMWYKDTGIVGAVNVTQWSDASGNARHLIPLSTEPIRSVASLNGFDTVQFSTADGATGTPLNHGATIAEGTGGTIFVVGYKDSNFAEAGFFTTRTAPDANHHPFSDGVVYDSSFSTVRKNCGAQVLPISNNWRILTMRSQNADYRIQIDATSQFTTGTNTFGFATFIFGVGSYNGIVTNYALLGEIAEVVVYTAFLSDGQVAQVIGYLQDRFAL